MSIRYRRSHGRCSVNKGVIKNFANPQESNGARVSFLIKLQASACNFINKKKKKILAQVFSCDFCEISKNTIFTEQLWATAPVGKK